MCWAFVLPARDSQSRMTSTCPSRRVLVMSPLHIYRGSSQRYYDKWQPMYLHTYIYTHTWSYMWIHVVCIQHIISYCILFVCYYWLFQFLVIYHRSKKHPKVIPGRLIGDSTRRFQNETAWNNKNGFIGGLKGFYVSKVGENWSLMFNGFGFWGVMLCGLLGLL